MPLWLLGSSYQMEKIYRNYRCNALEEKGWRCFIYICILKWRAKVSECSACTWGLRAKAGVLLSSKDARIPGASQGPLELMPTPSAQAPISWVWGSLEGWPDNLFWLGSHIPGWNGHKCYEEDLQRSWWFQLSFPFELASDSPSQLKKCHGSPSLIVGVVDWLPSSSLPNCC